MTQAVSEWLALDVKDIDEKKLLPDVIGKDGVQPHLPTRMVKIPFDNPDQVAVVSWRWDGDLQTKGSRNIASVIRVAKQRGIRYLFIDIISINQKLPPSDLIAQVAAFSTLYTKIKILAAYDLEEKEASDMMFTVFRPWISNEMRLLRQNPDRIVYAGHSRQGSRLMDSSLVDSSGLYDKDSYPTDSCPHFVALLNFVWTTSFAASIGGVLSGEIGMSDISDFKYIIPAYSHIISVAYEQMVRNDYLLTIAIFCSNFRETGTSFLSKASERLIPTLKYSRYSFRIVPDDSGVPDDLGTIWVYEIALDGTPVADWTDRRNEGNDYRVCKFHASQGSERVIFEALGLADSDYEKFVATEEARFACLQEDNRQEISGPFVEVIEVDFVSE
ncbi:hypothetical protein IG631_16723 [Alternaria alternata]|nr:hypothetical protein IG631_16723 [Alternaria alternata]